MQDSPLDDQSIMEDNPENTKYFFLQLLHTAIVLDISNRILRCHQSPCRFQSFYTHTHKQKQNKKHVHLSCSQER